MTSTVVNRLVDNGDDEIVVLDRAYNVPHKVALSLTTTVHLGKMNHPCRAGSWPAWASLAIVHGLQGSGPGDLYVTWASSADELGTPGQRTELHGIPMTVSQLYTWDWGPVSHPVSAVIATILHGEQDANT